MVRFHFIGFFAILIIIPHITGSLLFQSAEEILNSSGSLQCQGYDGTFPSDCNLCAMRVYNYTDNTTDETMSFTTWNCIRFTNTFHQYIQARNCTDFSETNDIGIGTCDLMPYENVDDITLCICATDMCTKDLSTCTKSVQKAEDPVVLPNIMANLNMKIKCADGSFQYLCSLLPEYLYTDYSSCEEYNQNNNVLCVISSDSNRFTQLAMTYDYYQIYVTDALYTLKPVIGASTVRSSNNSIYAIYPSAAGTSNEQCGCAYSSFCNEDMATCASTLIETETNDTGKLSTDTFADVTLEYTSASGLKDFKIAFSFTDTTASSTSPTTVGNTTVSITSSSSSRTNPTLATTSQTTVGNTTDSFTSSISSTTNATSAATSQTTAGNTSTGSITSSSSSTTNVTSVTTSQTAAGSTTDSFTSSISPTTNATSAATSQTTAGNTTTISAPSSSSSSSTSGVTSSASSTTNSVNTTSSLSTNTTSTTAGTTSILNTLTSSMSTATVANSPSNSTGLSRGAIAGIVVGSVLGGIIIISIGVFASVGSGQLSAPFSRSHNYQL